MPKKKNKNSMKKIAEERISDLFDFADKLFTDPYYSNISDTQRQRYADRYMELARKISERHNTPIRKVLKKRFCKHCGTYLRDGLNARIRTRNGMLVTYCFSCKRYARMNLTKENESGEKNLSKDEDGGSHGETR